MTNNNWHEDVLKSLNFQQTDSKQVLNQQILAMDGLAKLQQDNAATILQTNELIEEAENLLKDLGSQQEKPDLSALLELTDQLDLDSNEIYSSGPHQENYFNQLESVIFNENVDPQEFLNIQYDYGKKHNYVFSKNVYALLDERSLADLKRVITEDLSYKKADCDKYDYMIAGTCGLIGALLDIIFVGIPKDSIFDEKISDPAVDKAVEMFAKICGWSGPGEGSDATKSAIGFLERKFTVNYDQAKGADIRNLTDGAVNISLAAKNHHLKNLAHSPDLIGLIFSIINQFTSTSSFVEKGSLITINSETYELHGSNFISKLFCGLSNWLGHVMSDIAGSSGSNLRGSGLPIPFYSLFQFISVGEFGQYKDTFGEVCVRVFQKGYDFRHGLSMAMPVIFTELSIRLMYTIRCRFCKQLSWKESLPKSSPELQRMLLVGHGVLCFIDTADAGIRSGGDIVAFMLRSNPVAWVRFGHLAYKELLSTLKAGHLDIEKTDKYLNDEYKRLVLEMKDNSQKNGKA